MDYKQYTNKVILGDSRQVLKDFPDSFFDVAITSPPYYDLREYTGGDEAHSTAEIGREPTMQAYILDLLSVFDAVWPKLKPTGSLWVNIADKYTGGVPMRVPQEFERMMSTARQWKLINICVWYKTDAMAESQHRRFSQKWEPVYWFVKNEKDYYWDDDATKIPPKPISVERMKYDFGGDKIATSRMRGLVSKREDAADQMVSQGVNCGDVWRMATNKLKLKHVAPFPEELVARPLLACCPPNGVSLDPFAGSGTVGRVTLSMGEGRSFYGVDCDPDAVEEANSLLGQREMQPSLF